MAIDEFNRGFVGGRALDTADVWYVASEGQYERACQYPNFLGDEATLRDLLAHMADVEMFLVSLFRLRRAVVLVAETFDGLDGLRDAITEFDNSLPALQRLRDIAEHFDDYILGIGRHAPGCGVGVRLQRDAEGEPRTITRGDHSVDLGQALRLARELYAALYREIGKSPPPLLTDKSTP